MQIRYSFNSLQVVVESKFYIFEENSESSSLSDGMMVFYVLAINHESFCALSVYKWNVGANS